VKCFRSSHALNFSKELLNYEWNLKQTISRFLRFKKEENGKLIKVFWGVEKKIN
jgi:hypothetical protein